MPFSLQLSHAAPASVDSPLLVIILPQDPSLDAAVRVVELDRQVDLVIVTAALLPAEPSSG